MSKIYFFSMPVSWLVNASTVLRKENDSPDPHKVNGIWNSVALLNVFWEKKVIWNDS